MAEIAIVTMPFQPMRSPPIAPALLKAELAQAGIRADCHHLELLFASMVGQAPYARVVEQPQSYLAGEWVFSAALSPGHAELVETYLSTVIVPDPDARKPEAAEAAARQTRADLSCLRGHVDPFLDRCMTEIDWSRYRLVGFSSSYQQHVAALALARRLKHRFPDLFIVFGGANCEAEMGEATFRLFPWIDAVCQGEGDEIFPRLAAGVLSGAPPEPLPGVWRRGMAAPAKPVVVRVLDALPNPDFDDFFEQFDRLGLRPGYLEFPFQATRGCWWGEKNHCVFCGFNGSGMAMRQKSPERVIDELTALLERYGHRSRKVAGADNIVPMEYFTTLFPRLAERSHGGILFFEIKANLRKPQVAAMAQAGAHSVQPGIESLSTPVLRLLRKGTTMLQNVQLLKWCAEFGITAWWSFLANFPGECNAHYDGMADLLRSLAHLTPPAPFGIHKVRLDRFSPYVSTPEAFGIQNLRPVPAYAFVFPEIAETALRDLAFFFAGDYGDTEDVGQRMAMLGDMVNEWEACRDSAALFSVATPEALIIGDFRPTATQSVFFLTGAVRLLYEACDAIHSPRALEALPELKGLAVQSILDALMSDRLLIQENGTYLALAIPIGNGHTPPAEAWGTFLAACGGLFQRPTH